MIPKTIDVAVPILPAFAERYSGVCFDPERPVSHEQLLASRGAYFTLYQARFAGAAAEL